MKLLTLKGAIVTIDAMGCQKELAATIVEKGADYVLALKGNQGTLSDDVELLFTAQKACNFKDTTVSRHRTLEKSHGRIETRTYTALGDIDWPTKSHRGWAGLKSIVMVESVREIVGGKTDLRIPARRAFTSPRSAPTPSARARRSAATWGVENIVTPVGLRPPFVTTPASHSHPD